LKRADDPRHKKRKKAIQELFAYSFTERTELGNLAKKVLKQSAHTDKVIRKCAREWPIDKINRIDLAILRLALTELKIKSAPKKVIIDEAVELAKTYGAEASPSFVNGVLGSAIKSQEENKDG
jgi:N utilization substance protein B